MNLAYLTTVYPSVSHTFIRREILGLETSGRTVERFSIRKPDNCVDALDIQEESKTFYCLENSLFSVVKDTVEALLRYPANWINSLFTTLRFSRASDRGLIVHLAYLAEACVLVKEMKKRNVEHVHAHFGTNSTTVALLVKKLGGISYSFTVHGPDEFDSPIGLNLNQKITESEFVVAISDYGAAQLKRWVPVKYWNKIIVVGCIVDSDFSTDSDAHVKYEATNTIVCVARLSAQKGIFILLEAIKTLKDKNIIVNLVLAGDGELRSTVESCIKDLNLSNQVKITGWIDGQQVKQHILKSKALVLPSFAEGLPVVIMEAFALKKPVITTWVAGIPELVIDKQNGWLTPPNNAGLLVDALMELLNASEQRLSEMGEHGFNAIQNSHTELSEIPKLEQALSKIAR